MLRSKNGNYLAYLNNRMTSVKEATKAEALSILNSPTFGEGYYVIARKAIAEIRSIPMEVRA